MGVKPTSLKIFAIKLALFGCALLYMGCDLLLWRGPVWHAIYGSGAAADTSEPVAEVYGKAITSAQLQRYGQEQDALAGRDEPEPQRRAAMAMDLVRGALLRIRTQYNDKNLPDCHEEAEREVGRLARRARSEESFEQCLASQGYTSKSFTDKVEVRLRSLALLERMMEPLVQADDAEINRVYRQLAQELRVPASREASHIFLATLGHNPARVREKAESLLTRLHAGEDFSALAREYSEDERSAPMGGKLGTLTDNEHRPLPGLPLFGERAIAAGVPVLAQSEWGWHILLAGEISPERAMGEEEAKESLRTAILSVRREQALNAYFEAAVREGFQKKRIRVHVK